jgi:hypothetical protein
VLLEPMNGLMGALRVMCAVIVIGVTVGMEKCIVTARAVGVRSGVFGALWLMTVSGAVRVFGAECCWS